MRLYWPYSIELIELLIDIVSEAACLFLDNYIYNDNN